MPHADQNTEHGRYKPSTESTTASPAVRGDPGLSPTMTFISTLLICIEIRNDPAWYPYPTVDIGNVKTGTKSQQYTRRQAPCIFLGHAVKKQRNIETLGLS